MSGALTLDEQRAELRAEFRGWTIVYTRPPDSPPRWWAVRGGVVGERLDERGSLDADSPEGLRAKLRRTAGATR